MMVVKRFLLVMLVANYVWLCSVVVAQGGNAITPAASGNLSKGQVDVIIDRFAGRPFDDFQDFAFGLYNSGQAFLSREQLNSLANFAVKEPLSGKQREVMFRVLGLYSQFKYGGDALRSLKQLIEIPTVDGASMVEVAERSRKDRNRKKRSNNAAQVVATAKLLQQMSKEFGLRFRKVDDNLFEISLPFKQSKARDIALHTHIGVSDAQAKNWVVNGAKLNPYTLTKLQGNLYGRGVQDNKNAIVIVMYAMRVMIEENISLLNNVTLLVDTSDHSKHAGIVHYLETHKAPSYNVLLDGSYPVSQSTAIYAEGDKSNQPIGKNNVSEVSTSQASSNANNYRSRWGKALLRVATESLNATVAMPSEAHSALYLHAPNTLQFGLALPNEKGADPLGVEYKTVDQFLLDFQIVTEVIARIGQMRELD